MCLPYLAAELQAIFAGYHDVEHKKCRAHPFGFRDDGMSGGKKFDGKSSAFQVMAHQTRNIRVVLDHVNVRFHVDIVRGKGP